MKVGFPYRIGGMGRTALQDEPAHIRALIEQLLFTDTGERVNRPSFGTGIRHMLFRNESDEVVAALQFLVEGALQQWLGDLIDLSRVTVETKDSQLIVTIAYTIRRTKVSEVAKLTY